jgi:hypothetical protein
MLWNPAVSDPSGTLAVGGRMSTIKYEAADQVDPNLIDTWLAEVHARL